MKKADYKKGLVEKRQTLKKLEQQRADLDRKIARVRLDIGSLAQLSGQWENVSSLISNTKKQVLKDSKKRPALKVSVREVLRAADEPLTPQEVLEGIERLGRKGDHANNLASVYTTLKRMVEMSEATESSKDGKKAYMLRG